MQVDEDTHRLDCTSVLSLTVARVTWLAVLHALASIGGSDGSALSTGGRAILQPLSQTVVQDIFQFHFHRFPPAVAILVCRATAAIATVIRIAMAIEKGNGSCVAMGIQMVIDAIALVVRRVKISIARVIRRRRWGTFLRVRRKSVHGPAVQTSSVSFSTSLHLIIQLKSQHSTPIIHDNIHTNTQLLHS